MTIKPIDQPLPGEQVVALSPESAAEAASVWLARPNLFPGRALTAPTLQRRQRWQAGRLALRGQRLTAGVVDGLEVGYEAVPLPGGGRPDITLTIAAGRGLAVNGEDVVLPQPVEIHLRDLPVFAEPSIEASLPPEPVRAPSPTPTLSRLPSPSLRRSRPDRTMSHRLPATKSASVRSLSRRRQKRWARPTRRCAHARSCGAVSAR